MDTKTIKLIKESGFALTAVIAVVAAIALVVAAAVLVMQKQNNDPANAGKSGSSYSKANVGNNDTNIPKNVNQAEPDLRIYNFGLASLSDVGITTNATRDFTKSGHKGLYIFGDILPGTPVRHNPNLEFASLKEGTKLVSAIDGVVGFIKEQPDSSDFEVFLMPNEQSDWIIGYDHVSDVTVKKGDKVKVGDVLGVPTRQGNGLLRFEFQINRNQKGQEDMHICPTTLLDPSVKDSLVKQLKDTQDSWENTTGLELYDTTKQDPIGCTQKEMTPAFAQGTTQQ